MRATLEWMMASRWRAALVMFATASLPLLDLLAAAVLALVTLRHGPREAAWVAALAGIALWMTDIILGIPVTRFIALLVISWLPVVLLATTLRATTSPARVLQAVALLGCGVVVGIHAALGDPAPVWQEVALTRILPWLDAAGVEYDRAAVEDGLPAISGLMTGLAAGFWIITQWLAVVLGRWWQSLLVNPGGFRREFHTLRLGQGITLIAGALFVAAPLTGLPLAVNLALVLLLVFALQGLAVVHGIVGQARMHWVWLAGMYILLLVLPPHMIGLLALAGFADQWVDFRGRMRTDSGGV